MNITNFRAISNRADWLETIELIDDDTGEVITDLSGVTISLQVRKPGECSALLSASTEDGKITFPGNGIIQILIPRTEFSRMQGGTYDIGLTVTRDGFTEQEILGSLPFVDGVVR